MVQREFVFVFACQPVQVLLCLCVCVENNTPPPHNQSVCLPLSTDSFLTCEVWKEKVSQHGSVFVLVCTLLNKCEAVALSVWTLEKTNAHLLLSVDREGHRAVPLLSLLRPL